MHLNYLKISLLIVSFFRLTMLPPLSENKAKVTLRSLTSDIIEDVLDLSKEELHQDVTIICQNGAFFRTNILLLASIFPIFRDVLASFAESDSDLVISLPDTELSEWEVFYDRLYQKSSGISTTTLMQRLWSSDKLSDTSLFENHDIDTDLGDHDNIIEMKNETESHVNPFQEQENSELFVSIGILKKENGLADKSGSGKECQKRNEITSEEANEIIIKNPKAKRTNVFPTRFTGETLDPETGLLLDKALYMKKRHVEYVKARGNWLKNKDVFLFEYFIPDPNDKSKFSCNICQTQILDIPTKGPRGTKHKMREHLLVEHNIENDKEVNFRFVCSQCGKGHKQKHSRNMCELKHTQNFTIFCPVETCRKGFYAKGPLKQHMRSHTRETTNQCDICHKQFKKILWLRKHMKGHTTE